MARSRRAAEPTPTPVDEPREALADEQAREAIELEVASEQPEPEPEPEPVTPTAPVGGACLEPNGPTPRCLRDMVRGRLPDGTLTHRCERCGLERAR